MQLRHRRGDPTTWTVLTTGAAALAVLAVLTACASGGTSPTPGPTASTPGSGPVPSSGTSAAPTSGSNTSGPAVVEVNPPGDIPDNQAFVPYAGSGFVLTIPEGWARSSAGKSTVFSDKYNTITIMSAPTAQAPTPDSVRTIDLPKIKAVSPGFVPGAVSTAQRKAGPAVLSTYHAYSAVNPVTGKVANEAVERYTFWRAGTAVTLTLAAPVGADNVDAWRTVTDSFTWTK